jgi:hypothetical protein
VGLLQSLTMPRLAGGRGVGASGARLEVTTYSRNFCSRSRGDFDPADVALVDEKGARRSELPFPSEVRELDPA